MTERDPLPLDDGVEVEIIFEMTDDLSEGFLVLLGDDGRVLEIPVSRQDAVQLVEAMLEYVAPDHQLRAAPAAGSA
jgi:hypothetical protein